MGSGESGRSRPCGSTFDHRAHHEWPMRGKPADAQTRHALPFLQRPGRMTTARPTRSDEMFRRLILSAAIVTGAATGLAFTPATADAHPPVVVGYPPHRQARFEVLIQRRGCWEVYGVFRDRDDARRAAWRLRHRGFEVEVRRA